MSTSESPGSLAHEVRLLAHALGLTGQEYAPGADPSPGDKAAPDGVPTPDGAPAPGSPSPNAAGHPATCTWCPVCRGVESVRALDPDAVARLSEAMTALALALADVSALLRERLGSPASSPGPGPQGAPGAPTTTGAGSAGGRASYDIPVADGDLDADDVE